MSPASAVDAVLVAGAAATGSIDPVASSPVTAATSMTGDSTSGDVQLTATNPSAAAADVGTASTVTSWCVKAIHGTNYRMTACNVRTALQRQSSNNYIADDMQSQAHALGVPGLTDDDVWMSYNNTANQIVHMDPLQSVGDNCSSNQSFTISWYGVSFTSMDFTCAGSLTPFGLSASSGGGDWHGGNPGGTGGIEPIL